MNATRSLLIVKCHLALLKDTCKGMETLSFRNCLLVPDIFEPHKPTGHEAAYCCSSSQVKNAIHTLRIHHHYVYQVGSLKNGSESRCTGIDDSLRIHGRGVLGKQGFKTVGQDGVGEAEEQPSAECLAEHEERHGDGDLGWL